MCVTEAVVARCSRREKSNAPQRGGRCRHIQFTLCSPVAHLKQSPHILTNAARPPSSPPLSDAATADHLSHCTPVSWPSPCRFCLPVARLARPLFLLSTKLPSQLVVGLSRGSALVAPRLHPQHLPRHHCPRAYPADSRGTVLCVRWVARQVYRFRRKTLLSQPSSLF